MDNEMIERVAKAILLGDNEYAMAIAAIRAMREPTEKMISAIHGCYPDVPDKYAYAAAKLKIETMINAILND